MPAVYQALFWASTGDTVMNKTGTVPAVLFLKRKIEMGRVRAPFVVLVGSDVFDKAYKL